MDSRSGTGESVTRRAFIKLAGGVAGATAALPLLLEACGSASPAGGGSSPSGAGSAASKASANVYPTYLPVKNGPKPDFPSTGPEYEDAFQNYPKSPVKSWTGDPPGTGGNVNIMSIALFPPPNAYAQNPAWQAVNKALNANVQFNIVTAADYPAKLATVMAGGDLPDLLYLYTSPALHASSTLAAAPGVPQFLQTQAADLTPYLSGDAAKDYPFLAAIPTPAWKNAGCAYNGHLYLVPIHRYLPGFVWLKNANVWEKEFGADYVPKDAADFKRVLQQLTKPPNFYGMGAAQGSALWLTQFSQLFNAPNGWRLESNGKLVKDIETPEFKEATAYVRDLYTSGVFHPNSTSYASGVVARAEFAAGKWGVWLDPINGWQDAWRQALQHTPQFDVRMIPPFPGKAGGKAAHFVTGGHLWATAVKKGSPDRVKELLRILNYLASPFGTQEDQLLTFGVKDADYTVDANGNPSLTKQGNGDANYVPWKYVTQHPFVFFTPDLKDYAKIMNEAEHAMMPVAVSDPTFGLSSQTAFTKGIVLNQAVNDGLNDLVLGRRPMSDYDQVVKDWQDKGGEQIRKEYTEAIAANK